MANQARSKAVVITGASTGIGRACALYLDRRGFQVFAGVRRAEDGQALRENASDRLQAVFIDVNHNQMISAAVETVTRAVGSSGLAGLVNNAGIAIGGPLEFVPVDRFRQILEINVIGQLAVIQAFLPLLRRGGGRIVNVSSVSGRVAMPMLGPYAASKFALEALSDSLRVELRPWGIEVSLVEPGAIKTPIWEKSLAAGEKMFEQYPLQARELYGPALARMRLLAARTGEQGLPAETVARAVARALTARRPKTRYLIGRDARLGSFVGRLLPDRLRDWLVARR